MGRYYFCNSGREGKFWFAVQPSTDPKDIYGMNEIPADDMEYEEDNGYGECFVDYEAYDAERIKKRLDKQYDILGVPQEERKYEMEDVGDYVWHTLQKYYLTEKQTKDNDGNINIGYAMGDDSTLYPISKEKELAASRVQLGLNIYNEIKQLGYCSMTADL